MAEKTVLISADGQGNAGIAGFRSAADEARSWYPEGGWCNVVVYEIPASRVNPDCDHRSNILRDEDEDVDQYEIDACDYIDPPQPKCERADMHKWGEAIMTGELGGFRYTQQCEHCGLKGITHTNAQNPETGVQGYETTEYEF